MATRRTILDHRTISYENTFFTSRYPPRTRGWPLVSTASTAISTQRSRNIPRGRKETKSFAVNASILRLWRILVMWWCLYCTFPSELLELGIEFRGSVSAASDLGILPLHHKLTRRSNTLTKCPGCLDRKCHGNQGVDKLVTLQMRLLCIMSSFVH